METKHLRNEAGVTMIQFALVFPLLMIIITYIMDISYYLSVESLLDEAANRALTRAITINNIDIDPSGRPTTDYDFQRLLLARQKANQDGIEFLRGTNMINTDINQINPTSRTDLLAVRYVEDRHAGAAVIERAGVMVLMPGECAIVEALGRTECNRETLGTVATDPRPQQSPQFLLERHPVKVIAVARLASYLPFGTPEFAMATTFGYREPVPQGPFAAWEDPQLIAEGPPIPVVDDTPPTLGAPIPPEDTAYPCSSIVSWTVAIYETQGVSDPDVYQPSNLPYAVVPGACQPVPVHDPPVG